MTDYLFTFRSLTTAQNGQRALQAAAMTCGLTRAPEKAALSGCGYALRVPESDGTRAAAILREQNVSYHRIYRKQGNQEPEEVLL